MLNASEITVGDEAVDYAVYAVLLFAFHLPVFQSASNPVHSLSSYVIIVFLIHGKKIYIYIYILYSIRPIRWFMSLIYFFMYRSICNTV